jgi:hypothetical protein
MPSKLITLKRATYLVLTFMLLCLNACSPGSSDQETQPGWVTIDATLSMDDLENLVGTPAGPTSPTTMSLAEAQAKLLFAFSLPTWVPEGFILQGEIEVVLHTASSAYSTVILTWRNANEDEITLQVSPTNKTSSLTGGGSAEQVQVNGQPATLIRRSPKATPGRLSLRWEQNGLTYLLSGSEEIISAEELIRIAETVQP